jgi:hypothetical protein
VDREMLPGYTGHPCIEYDKILEMQRIHAGIEPVPVDVRQLPGCSTATRVVYKKKEK